jgi:hypothetical protein
MSVEKLRHLHESAGFSAAVEKLRWIFANLSLSRRPAEMKVRQGISRFYRHDSAS